MLLFIGVNLEFVPVCVCLMTRDLMFCSKAKKMYASDTRGSSASPELAPGSTAADDLISETGSVSSSRPSSRATLVENKDIRAIKVRVAVKDAALIL